MTTLSAIITPTNIVTASSVTTLINKTIGVSQLSGAVAISNGGTGQTTASAALNALGGATTGKSIAMTIVFGG